MLLEEGVTKCSGPLDLGSFGQSMPSIYYKPSGLFPPYVIFICIEKEDPDLSIISRVLLSTPVSLPLLGLLLALSFLLLSPFYSVFSSNSGG